MSMLVGELRGEIQDLIGRKHGKPFGASEIVFIEELPKTQSGKILRRVIASVHTGPEQGDLSSIENPAVLETLAEQS